MTANPRVPRAIATFAALSVVAVLAACAGNEPGPQGRPADTATSSPAIPAPAEVSRPRFRPVPDSLKFSATTIDGKAFDAAELAGKPVVLWFWAAWCPKCRAKSAEVAAVHRDLAAAVNVVGVAGLGSGDAAMGRFATDTGITGFPNLADDKGEVWRRFGVTTQEYFVLIDKSGAVVHKGPLTGTELRQRATALAG